MSITADMKLLHFFPILLGLITTIHCNDHCNIELPKDPLLRPKIFQNIGLRKIELPIAANTEVLYLFRKQEVELHCDTEFTRPDRYLKEDKVTVGCLHDYNRRNVYYECSPLKWKLYESVPDFHWCENNMTSYTLARPAKDNDRSSYEYLAGICYDTVANSFKTLYYRLAPKHVDNSHLDILGNFYEPAYEIQHYREIFRKRSINVQDYDSDAFRGWLNFSQYNLSSILQNPRMNRQFYVDSLLDIIWWPSLRLGNWQRYEKALENYIENANHSYDVLAGVSDVVKVPILENCATNFSLLDFSDNVNRKIPFYIWNYLRATDNSSEIVVIGVNSPFYEFYAEKDVIFCLDRCQEISWLKAKASTFRYSALGVIFCCSVDEVRQSQRLDGFPVTAMDSAPLLPSATPLYEYISTTTVESDNQDDDDNNDDDNTDY